MDTDALIKLTKAGGKEAIAQAVEIWIPPLVYREAVAHGKAAGYADASRIDTNVSAGRLRLAASSTPRRSPSLDLFVGGEREVVATFQKGDFFAVVSDDQRMLSRLKPLGIPFATPGTLLVLLVREARLAPGEARRLLDGLRPWISPDEYAICAMALEERHENKGYPTS